MMDKNDANLDVNLTNLDVNLKISYILVLCQNSKSKMADEAC